MRAGAFSRRPAPPLALQGAPYAWNVSVSTTEDFAATLRELAPILHELRAKVERGVAAPTSP